MMKAMGRWATLLIGLAAMLALLAAACAPPPVDEPSNNSAGPDLTATPTGISVQPVAGSTPTAEPTAEMRDRDMNTTMTESVSGKPLDPDAQYGGILETGALGEGPTFSTWEETAGITDDAIQPLSNMLIQPRTWGTIDDYRQNTFFEIHPDLASEWEISTDGLAYTFKLRDNVDWSDGAPVTCQDIKWSYDTIRTGEGLSRSPRAFHFKAVEDIQCPDDLTVVFRLQYPKPAMLEIIGMPYHVIRPAHVYAGTDLRALREKLPLVTSGPFTIAQWNAGELYIFERRDDYWDEPLPYLDGIALTILANSSQIAAIRNGRLHVGAKHGWSRGHADTLLRECGPDVCRFWPKLIAASFMPAIMPNHDRLPWGSDAVKTAIALAIDNQKYIDTVTPGYAVAPTGCGFYPTSEWAMPRERCAQIPGFADIYENQEEANAADKERARKILANAGYGPGDLSVTVTFWSAIQDSAPPIIEDLQAIGINAEPEILETARAYDAWTSGEFDIGVHAFWIRGLDPDITLYDHFYTGVERNYNRYDNPEFNTLVDTMSATLDKEQRKELAWQAMELALNEVGKAVVAHGSYVPTFNANVRGLMPALNYLAGYGPQARYDHTWLADAGS